MWTPFEVEDERTALRNTSTTVLSAQLDPNDPERQALAGGETPVSFSSSPSSSSRWVKWRCRLAAACVGLLAVGVLALTLSIVLKEDIDPALLEGPCVSSCPHCRTNVFHPPSAALPTPVLAPRKDPWFISTNLRGQPLSYDANEDAIRVDYKPHKWGSASGADFKSNPHHMLPADSAVMRYSVYFPPDFTWNKGGKLPGFCISDKYGACATGGHWHWDAGSLRMMFKEGGRAIGYAYIPEQAGIFGGRWGAWGLQSSEYKRVARDTGNTGNDLWCNVDGGLILKAGEWNDISMLVAMSTPGFANGWISISVNGETRTVKGVRWRGFSRKMQVSSVLFATFFGGGDASFAIDETTHALFRNFSVTAPADLSLTNI